MFAITVVVTGIGASGADANTVGQGASGSEVPLVTGQSLTIKLAPANSGSTGYHWRVARKPARSVLRLTSSRSNGTQQVFTYKARRSGVTSLKLQYEPPARHARAVKTFRLTTVVNAPEPIFDCNASGARESSTVATSGLARVFKVRRTAFVSAGGTPLRVGYDAYYGCVSGNAFRLGNLVSLTNPIDFWNVTLRGALVAFVYRPRCPFNGQGCEGFTPYVVTQDLRTGKVIRAVAVGACGPGCDNRVTGLVISATGGLAWIEQSPFGGVVHNQVRRSDAPAKPGEAFATDDEFLDLDDNGVVDPDSLEPDGTEVTWMRGGTLQRAPLR
jgi:hypothetical protein